MSVSMTKAEGVTVFTLTSDPQSAWPPLCQILKGLCYSPVCCSVSQHLRRVQKSSQSVLGALHIMVGLLNFGLAAILLSSRYGSSWQMDCTLFPFWLGAIFILFGIIGILSERFPSPCLVILNVILNLAGVGFAIAGIVLYSVNIADIWWECDDYYDPWRYRPYRPTPSTPSPWDNILKEKCLEGQQVILMLLRGMNVVLIVLSALELCLVISSAVMGIKALRSSEKRGNKKIGDPESYKPLLEEVTSNPTA